MSTTSSRETGWMSTRWTISRAASNWRAPIVGLSPTPERVLLQERNDVGNRIIGKAVAATMYNGAVVLLEADSGCAALDFEDLMSP